LFLQVQDWGLSLARQTYPEETLWFRAPELHAGGPPTTQSDLFTAAGSLFCLATNTAPAQGTTVEEVMRDWQAFNAGHVLSHMRPDLDPPLRDWLAWLLNLAPQLRPQSVAQALDMLMLSMHTGFTYMPQQAPAMAPGAQTTPLVSGTPPPHMPANTGVPQPVHSNAPKPKPILPKSAPAPATATTTAAAATPTPAAAPKKSTSRVLIAVVLNLAALTVIGFFVWPIIQKSIPNVEVSTATSSEKPTAVATPITTADSGKAAATVPAKPAPVPAAPTPAASVPAAATAVTAADAKGR